ncbi:MAG: iron ABC transporter permease [Methanobacteriota archaeon]|nr:MAG: iron ABC transporter permease [Euryarchaeota archaeon]
MIFAALSIAVLVVMVYQSVINRPFYEANPQLTLVGYDRVFADPDFLLALVNSNIVALLTLLAIPIGLYAAVVLQKLDVPLIRRVLEPLIFSSMFVSPILWGFGWLYMYGPGGFAPRLWGDLYGIVPVGIISALIHVPYVYVLVSTGLLSIDSSYENAARAQGAGPLRTTLKITLPLIRPAIFFSTVVLYILGIEQFGIPIVLLSPTSRNVLTTYIYQITTRSVNPDLSQVAVVASTMVYLSITLLLVQRYLSLRWVRRYAVVSGRTRGFSQIHVRWYVALLLIAPIVAYLVVTILLPLVAIIFRSLYGSFGQASLEVYEFVLQQSYLKNAIVNTVLVALLSASMASAVYFAYGFIMVRGRSKAVAGLIDIASTVPRAMPGLVAGLAFLWLFLFTPLRPIRYTLVGLAIAYVVLWSVLGTRIILTNLMQLSPELEEVGRALGASNSTVLARITIPLLKRAIVIAWLIAFIYGVRDYQVAVFLSTVDTQVIGSTIVHLFNSGDLGVIAALSTILLVITFAASMVVVRLGWKPYGTQV